jgi:hypothetical protein
VLTNYIYHPHVALHSQLKLRGLFPNLFRLNLADPANQNKLVNNFLWIPQIRLQDTMILKKYSNKEIEDKAFCRFLQHTLPGCSLKGLKAHIAGVVPPMPVAPSDARNGPSRVPHPPLSIHPPTSIPLSIMWNMRLPPELHPLLQCHVNCFPRRR